MAATSGRRWALTDSKANATTSRSTSEARKLFLIGREVFAARRRRAGLALPRLAVPLEEPSSDTAERDDPVSLHDIEQRLAADVTSERREELREAARQIAAGEGVGARGRRAGQRPPGSYRRAADNDLARLGVTSA